MKKHVLFVGLNDKDTKKQIVNRGKAKKIVHNIVGDCTISESVGYFTHEDGTEIKEVSLRIELFNKVDNAVYSMCKEIKEKLNQESVVLEVVESNSMFI